jgi:hypothetical protein
MAAAVVVGTAVPEGPPVLLAAQAAAFTAAVATVIADRC